MGVKGKLIASMEVRCGGHLIHDILHTNTHQVASISPGIINRFEVHEGEIGKVGTVNNMKFIDDGKEKTMKYVIEAIDHNKKSISRKVIGGDLLELYSSFKFISSCEHQMITWTLEYEKKIENNPEPLSLLGFVLHLTKDMDGHLLKK